MSARGRSSRKGARGRSIRLRIAFLVAIPLVTMLGLFTYVAVTTVTNFQNLDRVPGLIQTTSIPLTKFVNVLQQERRAAFVYASAPTAANMSAFTTATKSTDTALGIFQGVVDSPTTKQDAGATESAALAKMVSDVSGLNGLRGQVMGQKLDPVTGVFQDYSLVIADQDQVFQAEASSMTDTIASSQGLGLISAVNAREDVSEQDALVAGALAANDLTQEERSAFSLAYGRQFDDTQLYQKLLSSSELASYNATFNKLAPAGPVQGNLTQLQQAVTAGVTLTQIQQLAELKGTPLTSASWLQLTSAWENANFQGATNAAGATISTDQTLADNAKQRVYETAAGGGIGLLLTLIVTLILGRSINRRLGGLRRAALTLAQEQLPSVVARLRRGEAVDVAAEAPPLRHGKDEIGQVGEAIDRVRQTAIRSAIDEARVRQGVNDMFRNLARRNQSLLQRQLTALDEAERRTTDPDVLEDLFKMDHLTTRMRRHAEGLIILSGSAPGRSWSSPVKLIDVMRGAVAEVEDYARVTVSTTAGASLAGSAVTDVIHLLAELIENATTLSPPFTQVRVGGEIVANGFAIEIEDRGLGMNPQRLQELNRRLASPPEINPANTEQLGLFVVGQLARRHGLQVMLRPSPYGGTTAVVLIPTGLIVEGGPVAITTGSMPAVGDQGAGSGAFANGGFANGGFANGAPANGAPVNGAPANGAHKSGGLFGRKGGGSGKGARPADDRPTRTPAPMPAGMPGGMPSGMPTGPGRGGMPGQDGLPTRTSIRIGGHAGGNGPDTTRQNMPYEPAAAANMEPHFNGGGRGWAGSDEDVPVVTGVPVTRTGDQERLPDFDAFRPLRTVEQEGIPPFDSVTPQAYPDFAAREDSGRYVSPYSEPGGPGYQDGGIGGNLPGPVGNDANIGNGGISGAERQNGDEADSGTGDGLPRRVRQANLAPQLRASAKAGSKGAGAPPRASAASLTDMRNTLSAMQRGWQQGRSQAPRDNEGN